MRQPATARDALIAELLGDFVAVLDRIEAVAPSLRETRDQLELTATRLRGDVGPFQERICTMAFKTQDAAIQQITERSRALARATLDEQVRAMRECARRISTDEVALPLQRLVVDLQQTMRDANRRWEHWLTHAATAVVAAALSSILLAAYVDHPEAGRVARASVASPACAESPAPLREKSSTRR